MTNEINYNNSAVKYTVRLSNLDKGTITAIDQPEIKVGDFERNIQFVDEYGNNMSKNGMILEIFEVEVL